MARRLLYIVVLAAVVKSLILPTSVGVSWSNTIENKIEVCPADMNCSDYSINIFLNGFFEADKTGAFGSYTFNPSQLIPFVFGATNTKRCDDFGTCTTGSTEMVLPNGGTAYATPAINGDPIFQMNVSQVVSGVVRTLAGGTEYMLPSTIGVGDMIFTYEFDGYTLDYSDSRLNLTFMVQTTLGGTMDDILYDVNNDFMRFYLGNGLYMDFPRKCILNDGTNGTVYIQHYEYLSKTTQFMLSFPSSPWYQYSYAVWFGPNVSSSTLGLSPASDLNLFSGGFEYCALANCSTDAGVLSVALDRLGIGATPYSTALDFAQIIADFNLFDNLSFSPSIEHNNEEINPLIVEIDENDGSVKAITNSSILQYGPSNTNMITTSMAVAMLEEDSSVTVMNETITAPAGAIRIGITGYVPTGSSLSTSLFGLSFFLFALDGGNVVTSVTQTFGLYSTTVNISAMYLKLPTYGMVDANDYPITPIVNGYASGNNRGMIQLLLQLPPVSSNFSYEFFIGSKNIQYSSPESLSTSSSLSLESIINMGDTHGPTYSSKDGEPIPTKLLALPRGQFGLCFDSLCTTSAVKVGFTGLRNTERGRLNRFADAAAFAFSEPWHTFSSTGAEVWSMSFTALVPQSSFQPPIPYDASLASSYPTFSVRVDQYLTPGFAINCGQTLDVPRGSLKFSFNITDWVFKSDSDQLVLNVTLSNLVGDIIGPISIDTSAVNDVMRLTFPDGIYIDIPLLAELGGRSVNISITPVFDSEVGIVLVMAFNIFYGTLMYDPVVSSESLSAEDIVPTRTPAKYNIAEAAGIALSASLGVMVVSSAIRCMRTTPVKIDFSKIVL